MKLDGFFIPCIVLFLHISFSICNAVQVSSLYDKEDSLFELDHINFNQTVYGNNRAWIIEFYSSWCGHCQRFAPIWKEFARNIQNWNKVVNVGVVNCADPQNMGIVRHYNVTGFPTIKVFWHHISPTDSGKNIEGSRDVVSLENFIISFLESNWNKGVPPEWPQLEALKSLSFDEITRSKSPPPQSVILFVDFPESVTGQKVILDLSFQDSIIVKRVLSSDVEILKNLQSPISNQTLPTLIKFFRDGRDELFLSFEGKNESYIRDRVFKRLLGKPRIELHKYPHYENRTSTDGEILDAVYMVDLENALYYSLTQEVGAVQNIHNEKISALKAYLSVLKKYFPGSQPVINYLSQLNSWISYKTQSVTGQNFVEKMSELQGTDQYLPEMRDWIGCKGSSPDLRGYPCSLWTLFHTLTVQASLNKETTDNPEEVLEVIKDYVKNFFTCEECVQNFFKMDGNIEIKIVTPQDTVLWLWEAHNKVNHRLSGDETEDPNHPKVQFPPARLCPRCHEGLDAQWNKDQVIEFLSSFYSKKHIVTGTRTGASSRGQAYWFSTVCAAVLLILRYWLFQQSYGCS